jgi:hypothetical protein
MPLLKAEKEKMKKHNESSFIFIEKAKYVWSVLKYFITLLFFSRVSVLSVIAGVFIFGFTLQARDLFLEVRSCAWSDRLYWCIFYFLLIFVWLMPVYISSRYMIDGSGDSLKKVRGGSFASSIIFRILEIATPLLLVQACLLALGWSQYKAWIDLQGLVAALKEDRSVFGAVLPIPNVLLLIQATMLTAALFLTSLVTLSFKGQTGTRYFLSSICLAVSVLLLWFWLFSPQTELSQYMTEEEKMGPLIGPLPVFQWVRLCFPFLIALLWIIIYAALCPIDDLLPDREDLATPAAIMTLAALVLLLLVNPLWLTQYVERALLVPLVLGIWIPIFSRLSMAAVRTGLPLTLGAIAVITVLAMMNDAHVIRPAIPAIGEQIKLNAALVAWKYANGCITSTDGENCPPMLLVAAQGGASRSAFYTGSVLGDLVDKNGIASVKRIFAMSGVSGGAVGLAFFSAAFRDKKGGTSGLSPCLPPSTLETKYGNAAGDTKSGFINWFGASHIYGERANSVPGGEQDHHHWRSCMQILTSGDFISPVFLRLSGTDLLGLNRVLRDLGDTIAPFISTTAATVPSPSLGDRLGKDRAQVLEDAWRIHYERITGRNTLSRKFLDFGPDSGGAGEWRPLMILNATSTSTGRRVIASHLHPYYCDGNGWKRRIFNDAYDLHEIFAASKDNPHELHECSCVRDSKNTPWHLKCNRTKPKFDFTLSAAASLSSRFPIISPQADLKTAKDGDTLVTRVVDGGYFENHGATSLFDLVTAIRWLQEKLPIQIVLITNDPTFEYADCLEGRVAQDGDLAVKLPFPPEYQLWSGLRSILDASMATRTARGSNAAINLCKLQWTFKNVEFVHIGVRSKKNKVRDISMNWWLSYPVQLYLDSQVGQNFSPAQEKVANAASNADGFARIEAALKKGPKFSN